MDLITLDFETYYSKTYSLRKMTTEAYVRHEEFEIICVSVKKNKGATRCYWGDHYDIAKALAPYNLSKCAVLCHNTAFDGFILNEIFGIIPKFLFDTLSMARPMFNITVGGSLKALAEHFNLGVKGAEVVDAIGLHRDDFADIQKSAYMSYCDNDVDLTFDLFRELKKFFSQSELLVIDTTLRMFTEPHIVLDSSALGDHLRIIKANKAKLLEPLGGEKARPLLMSNDKFAGLLEKLGVASPTKISPTTKKVAHAFAKSDQEFMALREHEDPRVRMVVEARLGIKSTIEETRTASLMGVFERGSLPIMLNYYGAHTGRFSGGDGMNLQNLPSRGNNKIRCSLCAPKGFKLAVSDSAQIEARVVAWLAGQDDLVEAFREGRDVYCEFASDVYGRIITKADKTERFVGKTCILGLGYGMGAAKFKDTLMTQGGVDIPLEEAERIVKLYRGKYYKIIALWKRVDQAIKGIAVGGIGVINEKIPFTHEGFVLPNGMIIRYPGLQNTSDGMMYANKHNVYKQLHTSSSAIYKGTKIYGGKGVENIVQALARIVITDQMLEIRAKYNYPVLFQVHDELIFLVSDIEKGGAEKHLNNILDEMAKPPKWGLDIPVACEGDLADNYGEAK